MTRSLSLAFCVAFAGVVTAGTDWKTTLVKTPHGEFVLRVMYFSSGSSVDRPCAFIGNLEEVSGVGWRNLDLSVKLSGVSNDNPVSTDIPARIDAIGARENRDVNTKCHATMFPFVPTQTVVTFLGGTPDNEKTRASKLDEDLADYHRAQLVKLNSGSPGVFLAADRKCAEEFQQALSMDGLDRRKRMADLVLYKCGFIVDTGVHLAPLSVEALNTLHEKPAGYIQVTVADGESAGKSGWVPAKWVTGWQ
jgi:hypothetical protein